MELEYFQIREDDREILEQDDLFLAVVAKMEEVMKIKEAEIKKI